MSLQFAVTLLLPCLVAANEFNVPDGGYEFVAGEPTTLTWNPSTPNGTVTLDLLWGSIVGSSDSDEIDSNVPNDGSYTWTPPDDLPDFSNYTICLIPDQPPQNFECIPQFSIAGLGNSTDEEPSNTPSSTSSDGPEETGTRSDDNADEESTEESGGLSGAGKAGIGIGAGVGVLILIFAGFYCGRRRKKSSVKKANPGIPLTSTTQTPAGYVSPGISAAEAPSSGGVSELDSKWNAPPQVTELPGRHIREMGNTAPGYGSAELPGRGLQELHGYGRNDSREAVELPTIEHKFV
ncbi:hypothetical protein BJY00DRAFT_319001 [Aspergillus carlsbadensis]|nr:hypothetical protein BJY00DRAFT_319001 [Aspergillus carlsbadensis]